MSKKIYKIGTRGSLLAVTQCTQVKEELEKLTGDQFELEIIKTQGDLITDKPLWQLDGKDFFTKELDEALLTNKVDMVVHSYKDLGSERPQGIKLAAITKRHFAHDILFIKNETIKNLSNKKEFIVGTSSPRRIVNIEAQLSEYLPTDNIKVETKMLRGNVNTRIGKLVDGQYDAIVLALPGIERLAHSEKSLEELKVLLKDLNYMILPQSTFPSAASQGALAIECNAENTELYQKLQLIEDKVTVSEVSRERQAFNGYGGGCHLAVGVNVKRVGDNYIHSHRGKNEDKSISELRLESVSETFKGDKTNAFIGLPLEKVNGESHYIYDEFINKEQSSPISLNEKADFFATSNYCINQLENSRDSINNLWAAGTKTMKQLAKKGFWVNGTSDSLGHDELEILRQSKCIQVMNPKMSLNILTHRDSVSDIGKVIGCYERIETPMSDEYRRKLEQSEVFFWTSFNQYQRFCAQVPSIKDKFHCTGLGKTKQKFDENNIAAKAFIGIEDFKAWLKEE
ncbi:hydroxymethylbilane synthase [Halobacteriovorax marinus]|uniref:hydroxymethylbilane synthase n=1 Tax=Halobacteriovorax marinus TaxID=97084 RepID=UPI000BC3574E|nr:hydroxymethylbilane synthase [Halobacteriovorax marinus]ATH08187.1 hydroxymethylbilane synthase [Halobacteriovorax marinus]